MKTKLSKKVISVLLSIILIVTSIPMFAFTAMADGIDAVSPEYEQITTAMDNFKGKMNGKIYTNLLNAYNAYVDAQKAVDAYNYGGFTTDSDLAAKANALTSAMNAMEEWSYNGIDTAIPSFPDESGVTDPAAKYTEKGVANLLYAPKTEDNAQNKVVGATKGNVTMEIWYANNTVMLVDGKKTPAMPVLAMAKKDTTKARYVYQLYPAQSGTDVNSNDFAMTGIWKAANGNSNRTNNWVWTIDQTLGSAQGESGTPSTNARLTLSHKTGFGTTYYWASLANVMRFKGSQTEGGKKYNINWYGLAYNDAYSDNDKHYISHPANVYVINYEKLLKKMEDNRSRFSYQTGRSYSEGGLIDLITAYDAATKINVKGYDFASNTESAVNNLGGAIDDACAAIDGAQDIVNGNGYAALRIAFRDQIISTYNFSKEQLAETGKTGYTAESWAAFEQAYLAAQDIFRNIQTTGYNNNAGAMDAANALETAYENLEKEAEPVPSEGLELRINNAQYAINNKVFFTDASYAASNIENVVLNAKVAVWQSEKNYPAEVAKIPDNETNRGVVATQESNVGVAVSTLKINPDAVVYAYGGYSLNSIKEEAATYKPSDYSNYIAVSNAIAEADAFLSTATADASVEGDVERIVEKYKSHIKAIRDAIRDLRPSFTNLKNGTVINSGNSESFSMSHKEQWGAYSGNWYTTFTRPNNMVLFRTTHDEADFLLGDMNINFNAQGGNYDAHLDSINFGAINANTGTLTSSTGDSYALTATQVLEYPPSLSISAGGGYGNYILKNLYVTKGTADNGVLGKDANGNDVTSANYDFAPLLNKTDGSSPVKGTITARKGETQTRGDFVLNLIEETSKTLSASTKPFKKEYNVTAYMGVVFYWKYFSTTSTNAGYAYERTQYTQSTTVVDVSYLLDLVKLCSELNMLDYTADSWAQLEAALMAAQADYEYQNVDPAVIEADMITRYDNLYAAYKALLPPLTNTDIMNALDATRATYAAGNTQYSPESWAAFTAKYEAARDSVADGGLYSTLTIRELRNNDENKAAIKAVADELLSAFNSLVSLADFSPVDTAARTLIANLADNKFTVASLEAIKTTLAGFKYYSKDAQERAVVYADENSAIAAEAKEIAKITASLPTVTEEALRAAMDKVKASVQDPDAWNNVQEIIDYADNISLYAPVTYFAGTDYETVVQGIKYADQQDIDNEVANILSMMTPQSYTVKVVDENGSELVSQDYNYGTTANIESPTGDSVDWYYEYVSNTAENTSKFFTTDTAVEFVVKGNTTLKIRSASDAETVKVTYVNGINYNTFAVDYIAKGSTVSELPSKPVVPYYNSGDYRCNGKTFSESTVVNDNITVVVPYTMTQDAAMYEIYIANIVGDSGFDENLLDLPIYYNDEIKITAEGLTNGEVYVNEEAVAIENTRDAGADDIYAWAVYNLDTDLYEIVYYGSEYTFFAHQDAIVTALTKDDYDLIVSDEELFDASTLAQYNAVINVRPDPVISDTKFSVIGTYALPQGCEMVECGILFSKKSGADLTFNNVGNGVYRLKSSHQTEGNQFVISLTRPANMNSTPANYCSYVIYTGPDGLQHTAVSNTIQTTVEWA